MKLTNSCSQLPDIQKGPLLSRLCGLLCCSVSTVSLSPTQWCLGTRQNNNSSLFDQQRDVPRAGSAELQHECGERKRARRAHHYIQVHVCGMWTVHRKVKRYAQWFAASACLGTAAVPACEYTEGGRSALLLPQQATPATGRGLVRQQGVPNFFFFPATLTLRLKSSMYFMVFSQHMLLYLLFI